MRPTAPAKGLRQFLDEEQQHAWLEGKATPLDATERAEQSLEQRFKYAARFEKLLRRPQARDVLDILRLYGGRCIPVPRTRKPRQAPDSGQCQLDGVVHAAS